MTSTLGTVRNAARISRQPTFPFSSTEAFTDGIYAIAATLLVLDLRPPNVEPGDLASTLGDEWFLFLVYGLGFLQMAGGWSILRRLRTWAPTVDYYVVLLTLLIIAPFALEPFTLALLSESRGNADDFATALQVAAGALLASLAAYIATFEYLHRRKFFRDDLDPDIFTLAHRISKIIWLLPALTLILAPFLGTWAAVPLLIHLVLMLMPIDAMPRTPVEPS